MSDKWDKRERELDSLQEAFKRLIEEMLEHAKIWADLPKLPWRKWGYPLPVQKETTSEADAEDWRKGIER